MTNTFLLNKLRMYIYSISGSEQFEMVSLWSSDIFKVQ